jgi:hypothetical protein
VKNLLEAGKELRQTRAERDEAHEKAGELTIMLDAAVKAKDAAEAALRTEKYEHRHSIEQRDRFHAELIKLRERNARVCKAVHPQSPDQSCVRETGHDGRHSNVFGTLPWDVEAERAQQEEREELEAVYQAAKEYRHYAYQHHDVLDSDGWRSNKANVRLRDALAKVDARRSGK